MSVAWRDRGGGSLLGQYSKAGPAIIIDEKDLLTAIAALGNVTGYCCP